MGTCSQKAAARQDLRRKELIKSAVWDPPLIATPKQMLLVGRSMATVLHCQPPGLQRHSRAVQREEEAQVVYQQVAGIVQWRLRMEVLFQQRVQH